MKRRAGSVPEISVFPTEISVSGLEILPSEHFSPTLVTRAGFFLASDEELRRTQVVYTSGEALTETGNRAWKASGTQGNFSPVTGM